MTTLDSDEIKGAHKYLFDFLVGERRSLAIEGYREDVLNIFSQDVYDKIRKGGATWEESVPEVVAKAIKEKGLFV